MKKSLLKILCLTVFIALHSCAVITVPENPVSTVVELPDTPKEDLYVKANNWMVSAFNNAESVIQFSDKDAGQITGRYMLGMITAASQYGPANYAYAIINIKVKDGASKITVTPQEWRYAKGNMYTLYNEEKMNEDIASLISDFEKSMKAEADNDW